MKHIKTFQSLHEKTTHVEIKPIKFIPLGRLAAGDEIYLSWDGLSKVKVVSVKNGKYELSRGVGEENKNVLNAKEMSDLYLEPHAQFDGQDVYESNDVTNEHYKEEYKDMYWQAAEYIGQYGLKDFIGDILPKLLGVADNKNKDEAYRKLKDIQKML